MITWLFLSFWLSTIISIHNVKAIMVKEATAGHLAELPCLSSDDRHRFMFWQLTDDRKIIGPGNFHDENKYKYDVLTGKLYIRGVSTAESGFYKCVSRGIKDNSVINIHTIELIVKKNWDDVWENDFETNLLRSMAAVMVFVVTVAISLFICTLKRKNNRRFFEMEESRENSPERYRTNVKTGPSTSGSTDVTAIGVDDANMDVDFPTVFNQMQKEQAVS